MALRHPKLHTQSFLVGESRLASVALEGFFLGVSAQVVFVWWFGIEFLRAKAAFVEVACLNVKKLSMEEGTENTSGMNPRVLPQLVFAVARCSFVLTASPIANEY